MKPLRAFCHLPSEKPLGVGYKAIAEVEQRRSGSPRRSPSPRWHQPVTYPMMSSYIVDAAEMKAKPLFFFLLVMAGTMADGVDRVSAADNPCAAETDTAGMLNCLNRRDQELNGELERSYNQLVSVLSASSARTELQRLKSAQKAWKAYREAQLRFLQRMTADAGTTAPLLYLQDKISMIEHRIEQLKDGTRLAQ